MRKAFLLAFGLFLIGLICLGQQPKAYWQSRDQSSIIAGGGGATWNPQTSPACNAVGFGSSSTTFTAVPMGTGVVVVGIIDDQNTTHNSVTINGNSATKVSTNTATVTMWFASNTGTSGNIVLNASGSLDRVCISTGYLTGVTATPTASIGVTSGVHGSPTSLGSSLTIPGGGFGIVYGAFFIQGTTGIPFTWANATRNAITEVAINTGNSVGNGMANMTATGTPTFTCASACTFVDTGIIGGAWGP